MRLHLVCGIAISLAAVLWSATAPASAAGAVVTTSTYRGVTSELNTATLVISGDGATVEGLTVGSPIYRDANIPLACYTSLTLRGLAIRDNAVDATGAAESPDGLTANYKVTGRFTEGGLVTGSVTITPTFPARCPQRIVAWAAVARTGTESAAKSATYTGPVTSVFGGVGGDVTISTDARGTTVNALKTTTTPSCTADTIAIEAGIAADGVASIMSDVRRGQSIATEGRYVISFTGTTAVGVFVNNQQAREVVLPGGSTCGTVVGTFIAKSAAAAAPATATPAAGATPTPVATPSAAPPATLPAKAAFAAPPVFGSVGQAMAVFSGGTVDALEGAANATGATGVWVQEASGAYQLLVVGGPPFINQSFRSAFGAGLPANTPMTLVR